MLDLSLDDDRGTPLEVVRRVLRRARARLDEHDLAAIRARGGEEADPAVEVDEPSLRGIGDGRPHGRHERLRAGVTRLEERPGTDLEPRPRHLVDEHRALTVVEIGVGHDSQVGGC